MKVRLRFEVDMFKESTTSWQRRTLTEIKELLGETNKLSTVEDVLYPNKINMESLFELSTD